MSIEQQKKLAEKLKKSEKYSDVTREELERLDAIFWRFSCEHPWYSAVCRSLYRVLTRDDAACPTAAVGWLEGSLCLFINLKFFFNQTLRDQMFILAHEVEHVVRQHPSVMKKWEHKRQALNITMDTVINSSLEQNVFHYEPEIVVNYDRFIEACKNNANLSEEERGEVLPNNFNKDYVIFDSLPEYLIKYLPRKTEDTMIQDLVIEGIGGSGGAGSDSDESGNEPGDDQGQTNGKISLKDLMEKLYGTDGEFFDDDSVNDELKSVITEDLVNEAEKAAGTAPGHLKPYIDKIKDKANRDWRKALRGCGFSTRVDNWVSWGHINKRFPFQRPGRYFFTRPKACLIVDRSGSVGRNESIQFIKEMNSIIDFVDFDVMYVDVGFDPNNPKQYVKNITQMRMWEHFQDMGGGTNFDDVYEFLLHGEGKRKYESVFILTDGYLYGGKYGFVPGKLGRFNVAIMTKDHSEQFVEEAKKHGYTVVIIDDSKRGG